MAKKEKKKKVPALAKTGKSADPRMARLKKFAGGLNGKYGSRTIAMGIHWMEMPRIPSGSMSLDIALGGGYPVGRIIKFEGWESGGKTEKAMRGIGQAQRLCGHCYREAKIDGFIDEVDENTGEVFRLATGYCDCVTSGVYEPEIQHLEKLADFEARKEALEENSYREFRCCLIDQEGAFDASWSTKLGVDVDRLMVVRADTAQEALDIYEVLIRTGSIDLFCLDSIAALTPAEEIEGSFEDWQQGLQARLVNKFARTSQAANNAVARETGFPVTHFWINQYREKIGVMFGDNRTTPGGHGQDYVASVIIDCWTKQFNIEDEDGLTEKEGMAVATHCRMAFKVKKNKTAPPKASGSYLMGLHGASAGKVDEEDYMIQLAERFAQLKKDGSKWLLGMTSFKTKTAAVEAMMLNPREKDRIRRFILKRMAR